MNIPWTVGMVLLLFSTTVSATNIKNSTALATPNSAIAVTEAQILDRLASLNLPMEVEDTDEIVRRINQYIYAGQKETEAILGRTLAFFPVFEHYLSIHGLPAELKYLPMIESGLRPTVKSHVGAAGMWQLMGITARHHGLRVDDQVDERFDPYKSTEAAVRMLKYLNNQFDDWALVLAAYNAGPGRVRSAIQRAGADDFSTVSAHLPNETKRYVPAFLAAAYIANFYHLHQLEPQMQSVFNQDIRVLTVQTPWSFSKIAKVTGLSYQDIARLNPSYLTGIIPGNRYGNFLALPAAATEKMRTKLMEPLLQSEEKQVTTLYVVAPGDDLDSIAKMFHTTPENIRKWNSLGTQSVVLNQELTLFLSHDYLMNRA